MSGGVWFVVCIPTESHEKVLKYPPEDTKDSPGMCSVGIFHKLNPRMALFPFDLLHIFYKAVLIRDLDRIKELYILPE